MNTQIACDNLVAYSMQIGLLVGLAAFIPTVLRLRLPGSRLAYWHILLAACLLLPAIRPWKQAVLTLSAPVIPTVHEFVPPESAPPPVIPTSQIALYVLGAGMLIRMGWLATGFWRLARMRRHSRPLDPPSSWGVEAEIRVSEAISSPVTFGLRRPVVLLPANFSELDAAAQEAILCHEILHVRRHDWLFMLAEELVRGVFWFHPAIWWLLGEIGLAREQAVDRAVVEMTKSRDEYVDALLTIAGAKARMDLAPAPLFLRKRHLKQRVVSLLKEVRMSKARSISALAAGLGLLAMACWFVTATFPLAAAPQMVADGPGVTVDTGGAVMHRGSIVYPEAARRHRVQGLVTVEATLDSSGNVAETRVLYGPVEFRRAVQQAVLNWHFAADSPMNTRLVTVNFELPAQTLTPSPTLPDAATSAATSLDAAANRAAQIANQASQSQRQDPATRRQAIVRLNELQANMNLLNARVVVPSLEGKRVSGIFIGGLSAESTRDLTSRLPVRQGDTLGADTMDRVRAVVREFDEHLNVGAIENPDGGIALSIHMPGIAIASGGIVGGVPGGVSGGVRSGLIGGIVGGVPAEDSPADGTKRIHIGGNVQQAKLISQTRPAYPLLAKQARIQGVVHLAAIIGTEGNVTNLSVIAGHPLLVASALEAVRTWVYQKTLLNGEPVEVATQIDVNYTLSDDPPIQ